MTAIAGCIDATSGDLRIACNAVLQAQGTYGPLNPATRTLTGATFGRALTEQLPEDRFDRQPLIGADRFLLVADIRLDNREELLDNLNVAASDARTWSDADVLLATWMRWNEGSLDRIIGDYAFAVFDAAERKLTLARDPTGQRTLFYGRQADAIAFASMPAGLLHCPFLRIGFRFQRLATMLIGGTDTSPDTYFNGISRVLPGHVAVFSAGSAEVQRPYWQPPTKHLDLCDGEFVEAYHEHLERAVRAQLRRHSGLVGVHLSSGWDSSIVAATAARVTRDEKPLTFTSAPRLGFDGPVPRNRNADESELASLSAAMHGMQHIVIRPQKGVLSSLREHARLYQEPDRNIINMEWWTGIHRAARELGVSTLLVGQLGNLTIHAGGLPVLSEWIRMRAWTRWWSEARAAARSPAARWRGVLFNSFDGWLGQRSVRALQHAFLGIPKIAEQSYLHDHWLRKTRSASVRAAEELLAGSSYQRRLTLIRTQDIGLFRKGALGESGIDERDPTADRRVIDFSFALPPEQLLHRGVWRPLARRALLGHIPQAVLDSPHRGYQGADWFERLRQSDARAVCEEIAPSPAVNELLDFNRLRKDIDHWPATGWAGFRLQTIYRARLTTALSTGVFLQEFESSLRAGGSSG